MFFCFVFILFVLFYLEFVIFGFFFFFWLDCLIRIDYCVCFVFGNINLVFHNVKYSLVIWYTCCCCCCCSCSIWLLLLILHLSKFCVTHFVYNIYQNALHIKSAVVYIKFYTFIEMLPSTS